MTNGLNNGGNYVDYGVHFLVKVNQILKTLYLILILKQYLLFGYSSYIENSIIVINNIETMLQLCSENLPLWLKDHKCSK